MEQTRLIVEPYFKEKDREAITGKAALEFSKEAKLHPERYSYIARRVRKLVKVYSLGHHPVIMDFGCGPGILTAMIAKEIPNAKVMGIDLSEDMLTQAQDNIETHGNVSLVHHDVKCVYGNAPEMADIVVSRNMLHRLGNLQQGLLAMLRACKPKGGMVYSTSFRSLRDLGAKGQKLWLSDFHQRDSYPTLQTAWVLAYMNAPTLEQYRTAAIRVAHIVDAKDLQISSGCKNEVSILIRRG